jgi:hypothetical protein
MTVPSADSKALCWQAIGTSISIHQSIVMNAFFHEQRAMVEWVWIQFWWLPCLLLSFHSPWYFSPEIQYTVHRVPSFWACPPKETPKRKGVIVGGEPLADYSLKIHSCQNIDAKLFMLLTCWSQVLQSGSVRRRVSAVTVPWIAGAMDGGRFCNLLCSATPIRIARRMQIHFVQVTRDIWRWCLPRYSAFLPKGLIATSRIWSFTV